MHCIAFTTLLAYPLENCFVGSRFQPEARYLSWDTTYGRCMQSHSNSYPTRCIHVRKLTIVCYLIRRSLTEQRSWSASRNSFVWTAIGSLNPRNAPSTSAPLSSAQRLVLYTLTISRWINFRLFRELVHIREKKQTANIYQQLV